MLSCMPRGRCCFTLVFVAHCNDECCIDVVAAAVAVAAAVVVVGDVDVLGKGWFSCVLCAERMVRSSALEQRPSVQLHELV